jgi:alpha-galactosidase
MLAAPLMAGNDLANMSDTIRTILTNKDVIAIDQDTMGLQGFKLLRNGSIEIWIKALSGGDVAYCFLNRSTQTVDLNFDWKKFGVYHFSTDKVGFKLAKNTYQVKDLWSHKVIGKTSENLKAKIKGHDVVLVRLSKI